MTILHQMLLLSIIEQAQALAALSIARYSYCYWYEVVNNYNSPWYFYQNDTKECPIPEIGRCIRDVAVSAAADIRGFFGKVEAPADPNNPTQGGVRINISLSRAGKASERRWKTQKGIVYDSEGIPYYTNKSTLEPLPYNLLHGNGVIFMDIHAFLADNSIHNILE